MQEKVETPSKSKQEPHPPNKKISDTCQFKKDLKDCAKWLREEPKCLYIIQDTLMKCSFVLSKLNLLKKVFNNYLDLVGDLKTRSKMDKKTLLAQQEKLMSYIDEIDKTLNTICRSLSKWFSIPFYYELNNEEKNLMNFNYQIFVSTIIEEYFHFLISDFSYFQFEIKRYSLDLLIEPIIAYSSLTLIDRYTIMHFYYENRHEFDFFIPNFPSLSDLLRIAFVEVILTKDIITQLEGIKFEKLRTIIDQHKYDLNSLEVEKMVHPAGYSIHINDKEKMIFKYQSKINGMTANGFQMEIYREMLTNEPYPTTLSYDMKNVSIGTIEIPETYDHKELFFKQFFINTSSYRKMFPIIIEKDKRDKKLNNDSNHTNSKAKHYIRLKEINSKKDKIHVPSREEYIPILYGNYEDDSSDFSSDEEEEEQLHQLNINTEFFGYYLLNFLKLAPDFSVVSLITLNEPLIAMRQIPPDYEFINDLGNYNQYLVSMKIEDFFKMIRNFQLLRTIHFLFAIDDFNESNVAIKGGDILIVDLWTSAYMIIADELLLIDATIYHPYQIEALNIFFHYSISSIIKNETKMIEGDINGDHVKLVLTWTTLKALETFQKSEIGEIGFSDDIIENHTDWMKNDALLHSLLFEDLFSRSQERINALDVTNYFDQNEKFENYKVDAKIRFIQLFETLSRSLFSTLDKPDDHDNQQILFELKKNIRAFAYDCKGEVIDIDIFIEIINMRRDTNRTENIVILIFTRKTPSPDSSIYSDSRCHIFVNSLVLYDLFFMFFQEHGNILNVDSYQNLCSCPSSVFKYPKGRDSQ